MKPGAGPVPYKPIEVTADWQLVRNDRRTPFRHKAIETLTTNLGLPNIRGQEALLPELNRITAGQFLAISHFYPPDDQANSQAIHQAGLEMMVYWDQTRQAF